MKYLFILIINILLWCTAENACAQGVADSTKTYRTSYHKDSTVITPMVDTGVSGQGTTDTTFADSTTIRTDTVATKPKKIDSAGHELLIGGDIFHPILNQFTNNKYGTEIAIDYYHHHEIYYVLEGGAGGSTVNYDNLKYNTTNEFVRIGMNRAIVPRERWKDWDLMLIGFRLAAAPIHRGAATFTVTDSVWGNSNGNLPGNDYTAYWFELVGGMRVELFHGLFAGWTLRGKFIVNDKVFKQLAPLYVEGYGTGDKNVVFDFNFYVSYAIRWKRNRYW